MCSYLWDAIEGCPWALYAQSKPGIEDDSPTAVEAITDSIQKFVLQKKYSYDPYSTKSNRLEYPTLENQKFTVGSTESSHTDDDPTSINYPDQRRFQKSRKCNSNRNSDHKKWNRFSNSSHNQYRHQNPQLNLLSVACLNCLTAGCRVSRCPHPPDKDRIATNPAAWRSLNSVQCSINSVNLVHQLPLPTEMAQEIYMTEEFLGSNTSANENDSTVPNQPSVDQMSDSSQSDCEIKPRRTYSNTTYFVEQPNHTKHFLLPDDTDDNDSDDNMPSTKMEECQYVSDDNEDESSSNDSYDKWANKCPLIEYETDEIDPAESDSEENSSINSNTLYTKGIDSNNKENDSESFDSPSGDKSNSSSNDESDQGNSSSDDELPFLPFNYNYRNPNPEDSCSEDQEYYPDGNEGSGRRHGRRQQRSDQHNNIGKRIQIMPRSLGQKHAISTTLMMPTSGQPSRELTIHRITFQERSGPVRQTTQQTLHR